MANPNELTPTMFEVKETPTNAEWNALLNGWLFAKARGAAPFAHVALPNLENVFSPENPVLKCGKEAYYSIRREHAEQGEWFWRGYAAGCYVLHIKLLRCVGMRVRNVFCPKSSVTFSEKFKNEIRNQTNRSRSALA